MSNGIARPSFYEGQVLRAADLALGLEYARGQMARHDRYLHTPGIATGLELKVDKSTGVTEVSLSPGIAVDATGRQIVVSRREKLAAEDLDRSGVLIPADTAAWYPVFLVARDQSSMPPSFARGCGSAGVQANRTDEAYDVSYGRPGEELDDPPQVEVTDGPDSTDPARVLIGYVQWDGDSNFGDARAIPKTGMSPQYAGARADEVVARSGTLALRADLGVTREKQPALVLDGEEGGEMRFGLQDARGAVRQPVFRVNAAGDLMFTGRMKSQFANNVWVDSGTISNGLIIPLPPGVAQDQVDAGRVVLYVMVTPTGEAAERPPGETVGTWIRETYECRVDGRQAFARDRWFDVSNLSAPRIVSAACNYLILAFASGQGP